jgi:flavin reductase (DIM6/NTAB) family NADH-FMN oxidoreductase RutF
MRIPVKLPECYRLLNHGPVVLVTAAASGRDNVMPAAWVMPLDFDPPRVAAVIASGTFTRELVEASGELALSIPPASMLDALSDAGQLDGREVDKWARLGFVRESATLVGAPLVAGCLGWLECKIVDRTLAEKLDLLVCEPVAAWADDAAFRDGVWRFDDPARRTVHHLTGGQFFATGEPLVARGARKRIEPDPGRSPSAA